jgi:hypothetical protein
MEHFEAAQRKGVSAAALSYTASSAFDNAGAYTPPAAAYNPFPEPFPAASTPPAVEIPDVERAAAGNFAEAMPPSRQTVSTNTERQDTDGGTQRPITVNIANLNFNADELRTLADFVHQLELAVMEPEAVGV